MKLLILSDHFPPDSPGGAGQIALMQCRALQELGHEVLALTASQDRAAEPDLTVKGVTVYRHYLDYPLRWRAYLSLYNPVAARHVAAALDRVQPDIVHAHNVHTYLTYHSLTLAKQRGLPVVLTVHDVMTAAYQKFDSYIDPAWRHVPDTFDYHVRAWSQIKKQRFRYFPLRNALIRRIIARNVDVIASPSQALLDVLKANGIRAQEMRVLHNGIDPGSLASTPEQQAALREKLGLSGRRVILFAGRINGAKGGEQILSALPAVAQAVPDSLLLVLARPGGYGEQMLGRAEAMGIRQHIRFAGWLEGQELAAAFGLADVCVVPSITFDNFPTVALEAGAAGIPVVATCFGGAREIVVDGETGFIVNPYNVDMLSERIVAALSNEALRRSMGEAARTRILSRFDWLDQARKLVDIYRDLTAD